jgi:PHP family Zn ribbon phosphoesterase
MALDLPEIEYEEIFNHKKPLICQICGDKSKTYNYEVATCNGCKIFFKRAVIIRKTYICTKGGQCVINKGLSKFLILD